MKRKELLFTIIPLFLKTGYKVLTMDEIAKSLSISKKTIYKFFTNKEELISNVSEQMVLFFDGVMKSKESEAKNGIEFMFIMREEVEKIMSIEDQRRFLAQKDKLDLQISNRMIVASKKVLYHLAQYTLHKVEQEGFLNPNVDIHTTSIIFMNNYINLLMNTDFVSDQQYRHIMRNWYYQHLRGPFNNQGNTIMDEYIKLHPEVMR